jgi:prepilin-type N-terminal cleavage/methylation domain-containing protein
MRQHTPHLLTRSGFTLVELVVVLLILAAVAGLVIPVVGGLGRSTDMAASAKTQSDIANNLQQFFLLQKRYPQGCDSLLQNAGGTGTLALYGPVTDASGQQVSGMTTSSPNAFAALTLGSLTGQQLRSFSRSGFEYVFDHETYDPTTGAGAVNANDSGIYQRNVPSSTSSTFACAVLNPAVATNLATSSNLYAVLRGLVPSELKPNTTSPANWDWIPESGTQIVALGIGPRCRLVPTTMMSTPIYPGNDGKYYGRYIAYFKVFNTGERAILIGISDPYGRTSDYTINQFNESLPNGARQG